MNTLNFIFNNSSLNIYGSIDEPYFKASDVCRLIEIDPTSDLIRNVLKENPTGLKPAGLQMNGKNGKPIRFIDEDSLYEILFRSISPIAKQFKNEIKVWLKSQRLQLKLVNDSMIKDLNEEINDLNKQKESLQSEITTLQAERHIEFLSKNYNHRITWYKDRETDQLLFAVSYHNDNRKSQEKAAFNLLLNTLQDGIIGVKLVRDSNHYGKKEARKIVKESELVYRTHMNGEIELI